MSKQPSVLRFLARAREHAYRAWVRRVDEAILLSTDSDRAWNVRVTRTDSQEHVEVSEIDRLTGAPLEAERSSE